jgi:asparaginyl-tRNA synthetase
VINVWDKRQRAYAGITSFVLLFATQFFHEKGFLQLMPVMLSPITDPLGPDPQSSVIKTGEIEYLGQRLALTQSMILHKQLALQSGMGRLFILSPNVRLEHPCRAQSGRHLFEFTQLDFEIAHAQMEDVFLLMEEFLRRLFDEGKFRFAPELEALGRQLPHLQSPFPRYTTEELAREFGKEWEIPASMAHSSPFWALSHRREFYDREDPSLPGTYRNYDLIYPQGFGEALSGGEREWEYGRLVKRIGADRLEKGSYAPYLDAAREGLLPSAGGGFGIERLSRFISGAPHVGDVQLFRRVPGEAVVV